jgi:hypothetical protein
LKQGSLLDSTLLDSKQGSLLDLKAFGMPQTGLVLFAIAATF